MKNDNIFDYTKEYLLCSAIIFKGTIISGRQHKDCYKALGDIIGTDANAQDDRKDQGFLTSENRFVDRKEAWKIAESQGQIKYGYEASYNGEYSELISENLFNVS